MTQPCLVKCVSSTSTCLRTELNELKLLIDEHNEVFTND